MSIDVEPLAGLIAGMLAQAEAGSVVTVLPNGAIEVTPPGSVRPGNERRGPFIATYVAGSHATALADIEARLRRGLIKYSNRVA